MSDKFALYNGQAVYIEGIEGDEAQISFDDGREEIVPLETLTFL